ncbi:MAG: hypothetical protein JXA13_14125 [Anaerolineales bacterium]|nr:hypothetical protein [Anaerolineales bacterium]
MPISRFSILHHFVGQPGSGRVPYGVLAYSNGVLYGTTTYGGPPYKSKPKNPDNKGNLFKVNLNGKGFRVLHEFFGGINDGWKPWSGLAISGDSLYGSTLYGGPHGELGGVLYEVKTDGSGFRVLRALGGPGDGYGPSTSPILYENSLYGLTRWGDRSTGTIYRYDLLQGVYRQLYCFGADDGYEPLGALTPGGDSFLYGLAWHGGLHDLGVIFRLKTDGSEFELLHHFTGGDQGKFPYDTLAFDGEHTLYGTTLGAYGDDPSDLGTIFTYDLSGNRYTVLHKFAGGSRDSGKPNGSVVLSADGRRLYGSTHGDQVWGGKEYGCLYQMNIDGSEFDMLHEFKGKLWGDTPMRTPLLIGDQLVGMTAYGGKYNYGCIYQFQL